MAQEVVPHNPEETGPQHDWKKREEQLLKEVDHSIAWYRRFAARNRLSYRSFGLVVLICSVLAPILTASAESNPTLPFGVTVNQLALVITTTLALAEGMRRFFRFDQRWASAYLAAFTLKRLKEKYWDDQLSKRVGDSPWIETFSRFRIEADKVTENDTRDFFQHLLSEAANIAAGKPQTT